ncbi:MAG: beta-N-acetylhexosaminidase [Chitinophagaceae bacterium]|nr:MAG: beta-N-acetylhexosaminidase [Chitinophagaceae bacterium]
MFLVSLWDTKVNFRFFQFLSHKAAKIFFVLAFFVSLWDISFAQISLPHYPDSLFSTYYWQRVTQFRLLPYTQNDIIFLGNSITDGGEWVEMFQNKHVLNRGISGDVTTGVLNRLGDIVERKPAKVFLLIGINDLARGVPPDTVLKNELLIVRLIHQYSPATKVYVQSMFPVNPAKHIFPTHVNKRADITYINQHLKSFADSFGYVYVDVYDALKDSKGHLDLRYTNDGLHLLGPGYMVWKHVVFPYVYDLQQKPSLVPLPQSLQWTDEKFPMYACKTIFVENASLYNTGYGLQEMFAKQGRIVSLVSGIKNTADPAIELRLGKVEVPLNPQAAYSLNVTDKRIIITGNNARGVFYGIQTLRQLMRDDVFINGCYIKDWPAFSWRGYMVDVGRNFQSVKQLKQQIGVMAHYKLNIFHFHLTENIAWRLQIKKYPQLTAADNMLRDKGQYYTMDQMHDLIRYCEDRFITLLPEIDMPGHSDAFTRAFGFNMQSDSGLQVMKNIMSEVDSTYDIPYIHIGADEVKIHNKNFLPEIIRLIHSQSKKTIGWAPGGNYDNSTIRQLWQSEGPQESGYGNEVIRHIDSRDLYLNHMDPLSGVVSIFDRKIGGVKYQTKAMLGGEICLWNDDRAKSQKDILRMNLAYPAMLAFAERTWQGRGYDGFLTNMGSDTSARYQAFKKFENRLLDQKEEFFKHKPFPYVRQADIDWKMFGPFENYGDSAAKFWPEEKGASLPDSTANLVLSGGTIWLRHFFAPLVSGSLKDPKPNTTWYAYRRIYSLGDTTGYFWISFYNPSRSHVVSTPRLGQWDKRGSKTWIDGQLIPPPHWTYPGRDDNSENPLVDESYEYRPPTKVYLKKGWNSILVKAPVESFRGKDWQHPVKWMFTLVEVEKNSSK